MNTYRKLLGDMPTAESVLADAYAAYPGRPELANLSARVVFEGLYLAARYALEALVERVEREDALRVEPAAVFAGEDPAVLAALEVPPLSVIDDPEASDVGRLPQTATDPTRRDLRGAAS